MEEVHDRIQIFFWEGHLPLGDFSTFFFLYDMLRDDTQRLYYPSLARIMYI